MREIARRKA